MYWKALYMSEKREFMPGEAMPTRPSSFCFLVNSSSSYLPFFGAAGAAGAPDALGAAAAFGAAADDLALMLGSNLASFVWPSWCASISCESTPIASLLCMPRLPMAALETVSRARASTNSSYEMPPSSSASHLPMSWSSASSSIGTFQRSSARWISFLERRPERSRSMYWKALYMSEKREFIPVEAMPMRPLSFSSLANSSSSNFFFLGGEYMGAAGSGM